MIFCWSSSPFPDNAEAQFKELHVQGTVADRQPKGTIQVGVGGSAQERAWDESACSLVLETLKCSWLIYVRVET